MNANEEYMRGQVRNIYASSSKAKVLSLLCCHPRQGRNETVQLRSKQRSKRPHAILPSPSLKNQQQQHTETSRQPQWLSMTPSSPLLQWPVIVIGIVILLVALAGLVGAFWRMPRLLLFYLVAMLVVILLLASLVIFIYAVTVNGSGHPAPNRAYLEYRLEDYSGWLRRRVEGSYKWNRIKKCLSSTTVCAELNQTYRLAEDFFSARMSPLQSGCCKPPTACGYTFVNPTYWISPISSTSDVDCTLWSNDQMVLCYSCTSCKAGLLANLRREWRTADVVLVVTLVALIFVYVMGFCAFRNAKTDQLFRRYKQGHN